jgi:hypothetical protein
VTDEADPWLTEMCACGLQAHAIAAGTTSMESARRLIATRRRRRPFLPVLDDIAAPC